MRYAGPEPFPVETLGDLWDLPEHVRGMVERAETEAASIGREYDGALAHIEELEEQVRYARTLLDDLDTALLGATRLRDFRQTFHRLVRESPFEGD